MSYNIAGPYGSMTGTKYKYTAIGNVTQITYLEAWADSLYVYGIKAYWGTTSYLFGISPAGKQVSPSVNCTVIPIQKIRVVVDPFGILRCVMMWTFIGGDAWVLGFDSGGDVRAFSNPDDALTNMVAYVNNVGGIPTMVGISFIYTGPTPPSPDGPISPTMLSLPDSSTAQLSVAEVGWPAVSISVYAAVVIYAWMKVRKLRNRLAIKSPSCDPPLTTSPDDVQLWYRTFHAQENCKEMFLVYLLSIVVASTLGYQIIGEWALRVVGILAFAGAIFFYNAVNTYIKDGEKRGQFFFYASACMKLIFFLAIMSSGYLVGKESYHAAMNYASGKSEIMNE